MADSLKKAIDSGSNLPNWLCSIPQIKARQFQGGELGWFGRGMMVKPFEEAAFNNKVKEVTIVNSQFGIHIVQTTARGKESKQVQVATLIRNVTPGTQTYQKIYAQASEFAGKNLTKADFDAAVTEQNLEKKSASVRENDRYC